MARPRVCLYDIDGTLIDCGGVGRIAMNAAFVARFPHGKAAIDSIRFSGMTDPSIVRAAIVAAGESPTDEAIDAVLKGYLARLPQEIAAMRATGGAKVHPGVAVSLRAAADAGAAIGLGTGNMAEGAKHKLAQFDLWSAFAFGGFASDAEDRAELIGVGIQRGCNALGCAPTDCDVIVIGDTPRDVAAAQANGARCLAVSTGGFDGAALRAAGGDWVVAQLDDPVALLAVSTA